MIHRWKLQPYFSRPVNTYLIPLSQSHVCNLSFFGSRCCTGLQKHYHSVAGEEAYGRWAIYKNKKYLWGTHFYWLCDCKPISEVLEYNGDIYMVYRWAQELLGYHFSVLHWSAHMMADIDALTCRSDNITAQCFKISTLSSHYDRARYPASYVGDLKSVPRATKIPTTAHAPTLDIPIITDTIINGTIDAVTASQFYQCFSATKIFRLSLSSVPIMLHSSTGLYRLVPTVEPPTNTSGKMKKITSFQVINWLCIDYVNGSFIGW